MHVLALDERRSCMTGNVDLSTRRILLLFIFVFQRPRIFCFYRESDNFTQLGQTKKTFFRCLCFKINNFTIRYHKKIAADYCYSTSI